MKQQAQSIGTDNLAGTGMAAARTMTTMRVRRALAGRKVALVLALGLGLAGCVSTETVDNKGGGRPAGGTAAEGVSSVSSQVSPAEEKRRRARIRLELAVNHYQGGNMPLALQEIDQAIRIDPDYAAAHGMRGLVYAAMNDPEKADANFRQGLKLSPKDPELNNNYGWYLCQTGRQRESIRYFDVAAADHAYTTPAKPLHNAGICLMQMGDESGAEGYLLRAFKVDPSNAVAMYNLAELYLKRGTYDRAKFYSDRLLATYQPTAETLWQGIRVARLGNNTAYAHQLIDQLRRRYPQSPEATRLGQQGGDNEPQTYRGGAPSSNGPHDPENGQ